MAVVEQWVGVVVEVVVGVGGRVVEQWVGGMVVGRWVGGWTWDGGWWRDVGLWWVDGAATVQEEDEWSAAWASRSAGFSQHVGRSLGIRAASACCMVVPGVCARGGGGQARQGVGVEGRGGGGREEEWVLAVGWVAGWWDSGGWRWWWVRAIGWG